MTIISRPLEVASQSTDSKGFVYGDHFRKCVALQVGLRRLVYRLAGAPSPDTDRVADAIESLWCRLTSLEKSLTSGLLCDLLQPTQWMAPVAKKKRSPPTADEWLALVSEAVEEGPEATLDVLRRSPPAADLQPHRQRTRAAAWRLLGCPAAADFFEGKAGN